MKKMIALFMAIAICISMIPAAFAATPANVTIDTGKTGSINLYKYDITAAEADGEWDKSHVAIGSYDEEANTVLGNPYRVVDLGNGEVSYGYAIRGVEFTYARVSDILQYTGTDETGAGIVKILYGFNDNALLNALGLTKDDRYAPADHDGKLYYTADTPLTALRNGLDKKPTVIKNALEAIVKTSGTAMPETDSYGHSEAKNLDLGLYLMVETRVPEMVTETTAPFLISLPMTNAEGTEWMYDLTIYPKNGTSNPDLEKLVKEDEASTGKKDFDHKATASAGDTVDYQITSHLPSITSKASYLTTYTFKDTIFKGITYNRNDVVIEFFRDEACTSKIATWKEADGKFTVSYADNADGSASMTIAMTDSGLLEINTSTAVYDGSVESGYSQCYLRITYKATVNSNAEVVYGDNSNDNEVVLTWKRTNTSYYDALKDCCHVYVYGVDLVKKFSDDEGNFAKVKFTAYNQTDKYYVVAELNENGIYRVKGIADKDNATIFTPDAEGHIRIRGIEDDTYKITEVQTDKDYNLLANPITIEITNKGNGKHCKVCGVEGLTASATVDGTAVAMLENNGSLSAIVPLTVVNTRGFDIPHTGDNGVWMYGVVGILVMAAALGTIVIVCRKKKPAEK